LTLAPILFLFLAGKNFFQETNKSYIVMLSAVPVSIYLHASFIDKGPALEAPFYSAFLIPFALIALFSSLFEFSEDCKIERVHIYHLAIVAALLIGIGHIAITVSPTISLILVSGTTILVACLARFRTVVSANWSSINLPVVTISLVATMFQLVQNLEPGAGSGAVMNRAPYYSAYRDSDTAIGIKARIDSEKWLIENTLQSEIGPNKTLVIGDVRFAAMQLWGPNAASSSGILTDWDKNNILNVKPNIIASYESTAIPVSDTFFDEVAALGATIAFTSCSEYVFSAGGEILNLCIYKYEWQ
jgi:hypothetical protein